MRRRSAKATGPGVLYEHRRFLETLNFFLAINLIPSTKNKSMEIVEGKPCGSNALLWSPMRKRLQKLAGIKVGLGNECPFKYAKYDTRPIFEQLPFDESDSPGRSETGFGTLMSRR